MIYLRLAGGLGNQLFELAAAWALHRPDHGQVYLHAGGLKRYAVPRAFDAERLLRLPAWFISDESPEDRRPLAGLLMEARVGRLLPVLGGNDRNFAGLLARAEVGKHAESLWLDGYFQHGWTWPPFARVREQMLAAWRTNLPRPAPVDADCVVHIRGADFLASDAHQVVDAGYYARALNTLQQQLASLKSALVVTDDVAHAHSVLATLRSSNPTVDFRLPEAEPGHWLTDFLRLRDAPARVLGNSSFSWWAAALDANEAPTMTPRRWVRGVDRDLYLPWETSLSV